MNTNKVKRIIIYTAASCPPCKEYEPTFKRVSEMEEFSDLKFESFDIDDGEDHDLEIEELAIKTVPTTILLDENNEPIYKVMGKIPENDLINLINEALKDR